MRLADAIFIYSPVWKCQEKFRNRIDKNHDLLRNYADTGPAYTAHKEIIGAYCRNMIIVDLEFDESHRLTGNQSKTDDLSPGKNFEAMRNEE